MAISTLDLSEGCKNICFLSCPTLCAIWYHLCDLKNVKNTHEGVIPLESCRLKLATSLKITLLHGCFLHFLNCTNGTKWYQNIIISKICSRKFKMQMVQVKRKMTVLCKQKVQMVMKQLSAVLYQVRKP